MQQRRLFYTRAAKARLHMLPAQARLLLETHLENLALLAARLPPERLPLFVAREEDGFSTQVEGLRAHFAVSTAAHALLIHRIEAESMEEGGALERPAAEGGP
jgi:hypothetical protein